jgi:dTDP-4-dehydrorhamnose reductase
VFSSYNIHNTIAGTPIKVDIRKPKQVAEAFAIAQPDVVVHASALTHVDTCEVDKPLAWMINVEGTRNVALQAHKYQAFLIFISTDYVFSGTKGEYSETDNPAPVNYYGLTKLEGESIVQHVMEDWCIARPSVIYGARPAAGKINFVLWVIEKLRNTESINIVTDQIISPTYNVNLSDMIVEIAEKRLSGIYHLAGATTVNRYELAIRVANQFDLNAALINPVSSKEMRWTAQRPADSSLNVEKANRLLNNKPMSLDTAFTYLHKEWKK